MSPRARKMVASAIRELGREIARLLLTQVRGDSIPDHILLPTELVVRDSS